MIDLLNCFNNKKNLITDNIKFIFLDRITLIMVKLIFKRNFNIIVV